MEPETAFKFSSFAPKGLRIILLNPYIYMSIHHLRDKKFKGDARIRVLALRLLFAGASDLRLKAVSEGQPAAAKKKAGPERGEKNRLSA